VTTEFGAPVIQLSHKRPLTSDLLVGGNRVAVGAIVAAKIGPVVWDFFSLAVHLGRVRQLVLAVARHKSTLVIPCHRDRASREVVLDTVAAVQSGGRGAGKCSHPPGSLLGSVEDDAVHGRSSGLVVQVAGPPSVLRVTPVVRTPGSHDRFFFHGVVEFWVWKCPVLAGWLVVCILGLLVI
jgi:hypothetical protein